MLRYVITQNVDRLHSKAGSKNVLDLHGRNDRVRCLSCAYSCGRRLVQQQLDLLNPRLAAKFGAATAGERLRADGDAEIDGDDERIEVPCCPRCGGVLKPEVVYFGDSVPLEAVRVANEQAGACDGLLVAGSSLEVFSAYRLVTQAVARGVPLAIINRGPTRAERSGLQLALKLDAAVDDVMEQVLRRLQM
jgi:NAD-dependent SIR2 family protein deacetylase